MVRQAVQPAVPTSLETTLFEWVPDHYPVIDPNCAGNDLARDSQGAVHVRRPEARG